MARPSSHLTLRRHRPSLFSLVEARWHSSTVLPLPAPPAVEHLPARDYYGTNCSEPKKKKMERGKWGRFEGGGELNRRRGRSSCVRRGTRERGRERGPVFCATYFSFSALRPDYPRSGRKDGKSGFCGRREARAAPATAEKMSTAGEGHQLLCPQSP